MENTNQSYRYAFVLGRVFTLSIAELAAVLEKPDPAIGLTGGPVKILEASFEAIIIETSQSIDAGRLQKKLGGVIKILRVVDVVKKREQDSLNFALKHYFKPSILKREFFKDYKGKKQFGVSIYVLDEELLKPAPRSPMPRPEGKPGAPTQNIFSEPKRLGMMIKNTLAENGTSIRLVLPEFNSLSLASVSVTKNLLLEKGAEICVLAKKEALYVCRTLCVQDFEDYGRRDYQRPVRDEKQGMLPPKVAQIMLNLCGAQSGQTVLDPFCGIGTVVQEGLLLNFRMLGSDLNKAAIRGSEQNLEWFRNRYKIAPGKYHFQACDAREVGKFLEGQDIAAVVSEGTLGPMYSAYPKGPEIEKNFQDLEKLYRECLAEFTKFLKKGAKIVLCIPAYRKNREQYAMFPSLDFATELGYNFVDAIPAALSTKLSFLKLTPRKTVIYDRKDQVVAREICIFEKN